MKYGDTLVRRSVLEWQHYNVDYVEIKNFIKDHTTGRPLTGNAKDKTDFEDELYEIFVDQIGRIELFANSKVGEINRRLDECRRYLVRLENNTRFGPGRYAKVERDIERASYEIQRLSRFVNVQRTGFYKLLKKYKKWTGSDRLPSRVISLLELPTAFHKNDFECHVIRVSELLDAARDGMQAASKRSGRPEILWRNENGEPLILRKGSIQIDKPPVDVDTAFGTASIAEDGGKAVFWVHYDHLIEVQVLLLKQLSLQVSGQTKSVPSSPVPTLSRRSSVSSYVGKDDDVGVVLLDDAESFAGTHNSTTIDQILKAGMRTAGQVRWRARDPEAVVIVSEPSAAVMNGQPKSDQKRMELRIKRKHVEALFNRNSDGALHKHHQYLDKEAEISQIRQWFMDHPTIAPLVRIESRRTRFAGHSSGEVWAYLERDIKMAKICGERSWMVDIDDERTKLADSKIAEFPHAVLEIRWEGKNTPTFVNELSKSHLPSDVSQKVESVPGFAIDVHAISTLYEPKNIPPPFWIPALAKDIRKTPNVQPEINRRGSAQAAARMSYPSSSKSSSEAANVTQSADPSTPPTSDSGDMPDAQPGSMKKKRSHRKPSSPHIQSLRGQKYWNELDEEEQEEPFTVLVHAQNDDASDTEYDYDSLSRYLSQRFKNAASAFGGSLRRASARMSERTPLLPEVWGPNSASSSEVDVDLQEADATPNYETMSRRNTRRMISRLTHIGYLVSSGMVIIVTVGLSASNFTLSQSRKHKGLKSERGAGMDMALFVGIIVSLILGILGITSFVTSRSRYSTTHIVAVWSTFASMCLGCGAVFAMIATDSTNP